MRLFKSAKNLLKRHLTVMFIPHTDIRPLKITFTFSFLLFLLAAWTGITIWAGYVSGQNMDYWRLSTENRLMKLKVVFFAHQVLKSQEMLDQVRQNDQQIRTLLELKSKKEIIEYEGKGGPTDDQRNDFAKVLQDTLYNISQRDINRQTRDLQEEISQRMESYSEITSYLDKERAIIKATPNCWPCIGRVTSSFGMRMHPLHESNEFHSGIDIANERNTPVYATAYGKVMHCDWQAGYGRLIVLDHGYGYQTYYGHLQKILVKQDEFIKRGQLIALMGDTGASTGDHLHYEVQCNGQPVNPIHFLKKPSQNMEFSNKP